MTSNIKDFDGIVFDLDGTLVDSLPDMAAALNRFLSEQGRRELGIAEVRPLIGKGAAKMIQAALNLTGTRISRDKLAPAVTAYLSYYRESPVENSKIYDGVTAVLEELKNANLKMGICSNKAFEMVNLILESFDLAKYFCGVTGGDNVAFNKPDGRHIFETLRLMGIDNTNVLMVGDTINDIVAARDAGVSVVAVDYGYSGSNEFCTGTVVIDSFYKLLSEGYIVNEI